LLFSTLADLHNSIQIDLVFEETEVKCTPGLWTITVSATGNMLIYRPSKP